METEDGGGLKGGGETMDGVETVTVGAAETEATQAETAAETTETLLAAQANQTAETGGETQQQQQQSISYAATAKTKSGDKRKEVEDRTYSLEFASFLKVENFTAQFNEIFYPTANMSTRPVLQSVVRDIANRRLTHITFSTQAMHDKHTSEAYQVKGEDGRLFWIPAKLKGYQITIQKIPYWSLRDFGRFHILFRTHAHFQKAFNDGFFIGRKHISGRGKLASGSGQTGAGESGTRNPIRTGYVPNIPPWICMDDVRLLLSTHGEVLSVLTDITKKHGIRTGGVRFAIRLHEDQSMPDMLTILNVNYAVLYAGKRQKVHISTSTTNSAPVENSARAPAITGRDTSIVTTGTESSTENNPIHPSVYHTRNQRCVS